MPKVSRTVNKNPINLRPRRCPAPRWRRTDSWLLIACPLEVDPVTLAMIVPFTAHCAGTLRWNHVDRWVLTSAAC